MKPIPFSVPLFALFGCATAGAASVEVSATNPLPVARTAQTLEISAADLASLGVANLNLVHVRDADGREILCQAIDTDGDPLRKFDAVLFQSDFAPSETRKFTLVAGARQVYRKEDYKAFGRFVRERFDDFAWENDLIAHRTYGKALETWQGEPLSSSTIDVWSKRTPRMVINDWYLADDYHTDHGDGADFYSAGLSRGCGGSGVWAENRLWVSRNFVSSNVLANGPIRVLFELAYEPFSVGIGAVAETKRVSLDAGSQFDRIESRYQVYLHPSKTLTLTAATGLKKAAGEQVEANPAEGWICKWEPVEKGAGNQGLAIIARPGDFLKHETDALNQLVLLKPDDRHTTTSWSGFGWDKAGKFQDAAAWKAHVSAFAREIAAPVTLSIQSKP